MLIADRIIIYFVVVCVVVWALVLVTVVMMKTPPGISALESRVMKLEQQKAR